MTAMNNKSKTTADKLWDKVENGEELTRSQKARYESTKALLELAKLIPWGEKIEDNNHVIIDDKNRKIPLEPSSVKVSYTSRYNARCGYYNHQKLLLFKMNTDFWMNRNRSDKFGTLAHELVHIRIQNHSPEFWDILKMFLKIFAKNQDEVESIMGGNIDFEEVKDRTLNSIHSGSVDRRSESVREREDKMREVKDYGFKYGNESKIPSVDTISQISADKEE